MLKISEVYCEDECEAQGKINNHQKSPVLMKRVPFWSGAAVKNSKLINISMKDYFDKYLVLIFYPYDFTVVCPSELMQFNDRFEEFQDIDCDLVAISTDSQYTHLAWVTTPRKYGGLGGMNFPLLSDKNHEISKRYGVLDEDLGVPNKAIFIIDNKQVLRHTSSCDMAIPRSIDEVIRVINACQFVEKYGNVCPMRSECSDENKTTTKDNFANENKLD